MSRERSDRQSVSWLVLEQYALGELSEERAADVAARIEACEKTRRCLEMIEAESDRALPPLPAVAEAPRADWFRRWRLGMALVAAGATAAACILLLCRPTAPKERVAAAPGFPDRRAVVKGGGEVVLDLVRLRGRNGAVSHHPESFAPGDDFKVVVTCAPPLPLSGEVAVYQGDEVFFPLAAVDLECGNRVVIPGAFRLTGDQPATICFAFDPARRPDRAALERGPGAVSSVVCTRLEPR